MPSRAVETARTGRGAAVTPADLGRAQFHVRTELRLQRGFRRVARSAGRRPVEAELPNRRVLEGARLGKLRRQTLARRRRLFDRRLQKNGIGLGILNLLPFVDKLISKDVAPRRERRLSDIEIFFAARPHDEQRVRLDLLAGRRFLPFGIEIMARRGAQRRIERIAGKRREHEIVVVEPHSFRL